MIDEDMIYLFILNSILAFLILNMISVLYVANRIQRVEKVMVLTGINMLSGSSYLSHMNSLKESGLIDD